MESFSLPCAHGTESVPPPPSSEHVGDGVQAQPKSTVPKKKRKGIETRSKVWDHFEKIFNNESVLI